MRLLRHKGFHLGVGITDWATLFEELQVGDGRMSKRHFCTKAKLNKRKK